ncbi:hypothetical protein [Halorubrum sp. CSM-61]|uniref:hypothetical protein n=1 Tax=Halorubrum sp. CSM-61 TaxID=2485838 RepID=UPI000F4B9DDB|nr:hypothetical protein [Halorubrum sp. CSM-61]
MYTVTEEAIVETVARVFREERVLIESACVSPCAILDSLREEVAGKTVAIPVTGRNLPRPKVVRVMSRVSAPESRSLHSEREV